MKTILIDSGKVLNGPTTGHWFIPPKFFDYIDKAEFYKISSKNRNQAFERAVNKIDKINYFQDVSFEYERFTEFYIDVFKRLPSLNVSTESCRCIAHDLVYNPRKYTFYDDVYRALDELGEKYKLAVVSDAWPSLKGVFEYEHLYDKFDSFVVSTCIGTKKPDFKMYKTALDETETIAEEAIFIDDNIYNLDGARAVGIKKTYMMCRESNKYWWYKITQRRHIVVRNFDKIVDELMI